MANLKAVKRKMSKWGVLGNAFLSVVLAVSLMPSYAAFGDDGQEKAPKPRRSKTSKSSMSRLRTACRAMAKMKLRNKLRLV